MTRRARDERTLRGRVAVIGIGETEYYRHGASPDPEFKLALKAILAACEDAGLDPREIDGFSSYSDDRSEASRLAAALGTHRLRSATMQWGGGGGGCSAAVANAAASIVAGLADCVVVFRSLAQGQYGRFGQAAGIHTVSGERSYLMPYGVLAPPQRFAMRVQRYMHEHGVRQEALRAIALASYHHAQANPRAVMRGKPLDVEKYDASRWIVEPFHLYDCCMENDGAAALVLVSAERASDFRHKPAYLLGAAFGSGHRAAATAHNAPLYATANFDTVAPDLYRMAGVGPSDVGVVQAYENFTGGVVMALAEHGFFRPEKANDFLTFDNLIAPSGRLPLNTSGGNLAECYMHGFELVLEAVRQLRGASTNQARRNDVALVIGGPMVTPASNLILGSEATL
ncbi:thiolase C-terminal domain-containing protein [Bradyrhizobium elkanii]|uniref:thiolase C-terminal domain-containing protein n=1 Tax=Bradyrhizobium elkanii TaxID=29448 RepID=UPI001AE1B7DC|nr:acetyl-CoA acetyltransferase [Bradyrhizobium elkanii]MBP2427475.1 acetyl-CoA acetyltransferase [Bradyrhizobium elkanii]MCP1970678.1 acetyl-CoA acetyltransferase [Bradyrhizobium elkanii]MCS4107815.1 acetyl-CoA acetyltransferase [Bradyrhizobium elkanii]WLA94818.1 acetyl-CoA acetyltransferase [Bradyrhizobium elkanii]